MVDISLILSAFLSVLALALPVEQLCVDLRDIHTFIIEVNDENKLDLAADQIMFCIFDAIWPLKYFKKCHKISYLVLYKCVYLLFLRTIRFTTRGRL